MLQNCLNKDQLEAGCDEAGRGCLAGPVFAAAVILPKDFENDLLTDSKKLSEAARDSLRPIIEREALAWSVAKIDVDEIDSINILNASIKAMHKSIDGLKLRPTSLVIDGNRFKSYGSIGHTCVVKGDGKFMNIAAASILAKTHRDMYMSKLHEEFPQYLWNKNKAYGTKAHRNAIEEFGVTIHHRKSFKLLPTQLKLL